MNELLGPGHPLVNGSSGFFPPDHRRVLYVLAEPEWLTTRRARLAAFGITVAVDDVRGILLVLP
ncbi:MAG: hypothetical protein ABIR32_20355 [Ilumatobacteraceae bacterium]